MAWTTPKTWATEVLTSSGMNTYMRDNQNILKTSINDDGTLAVLQSGVVSSNWTLTTSTTLTDVTGLAFDIAASEDWLFAVIFHGNSPAAADWKFQVTVPTGATGRFGVFGRVSEVAIADAAIGTAIDLQGLGSDMSFIMQGRVLNSTTAGTVQIQAAQNTSSGTTTIYAGTGIIAVRIG